MFTYSGDTKEFTNTLIYDNQKYTHSNRISQESKNEFGKSLMPKKLEVTIKKVGYA
jgi:hypothetical protein